ncbi:hypothetical protein [Dechloromonas agitata]|uniref:hypothetical protein n=1 Tax=Dechloromonas agitata TaxID=73030 RepID=UPI0012F85871|nr:hypothetical protein [Dechloromonas agitata]
MDYTHQPVIALLRGPLVYTPQGLVVLASAVVYFAIAAAYLVFGITPPLGKDIEVVVALCLFWPFIVFLFFIKNGMPSFAPSRRGALFLSVVAGMPVLHVLWRTYT